MHTVTSFEADALAAGDLSAIIADYLALERLRIFRRLLVIRFGILTAVVAAAGWLWLPIVAMCLAAGLCVVPPLYVLMLEVTRELRLAGRLEQIPNQRTEALGAPAAAVDSQKVIKSP